MTLFKRLFGSAQGDEIRVRLFLETMLIMIAADGEVEDQEMGQFMALVRRREEMAHLPRRTLDKHMQDAFVAIRNEGLEKRIDAIARGLRHRDERIAAVGMALSIAMGDGELRHEEAAVLQMMQEAFELDDQTIDAALSAARTGGSLESLVDGAPPLEQSYLEAMMLMAAADGVIDAAELDKFGHELAHHREFDHIVPEQVGALMTRCLEALERDGVEGRLQALARELSQPEHRQIAFRMALEMCLADGTADEKERTLLKLLQTHFELTDEFVGQEIQKILGGRSSP